METEYVDVEDENPLEGYQFATGFDLVWVGSLVEIEKSRTGSSFLDLTKIQKKADVPAIPNSYIRWDEGTGFSLTKEWPEGEDSQHAVFDLTFLTNSRAIPSVEWDKMHREKFPKLYFIEEMMVGTGKTRGNIQGERWDHSTSATFVVGFRGYRYVRPWWGVGPFGWFANLEKEYYTN